MLIDPEHVVPALQDACGKLESAGGELVLDFSSVRRIEPGALGAMEKLAAEAAGKSVRVVLHGVNVDVYKVLLLTRLAPRFAFQN